MHCKNVAPFLAVLVLTGCPNPSPPPAPTITPTTQPSASILRSIAFPQNLAGFRTYPAVDSTGNIWVGLGGGLVEVTSAGQGTAKIFPPSTCASAHVGAATIGSDGNIWHTEYPGNGCGAILIAYVVRNSAGNVLHTYPILDTNGPSLGGALGPDNRIWYTKNTAGGLAAINASGLDTMYQNNGDPDGSMNIVVGSDSRLWYQNSTTNELHAATTAGVYSNYAVGNDVINFIASGTDGNIYAAEANGVYQVSVSGSSRLAQFQVTGYNDVGLSSATDGAVWALICTPSAPAACDLQRITSSLQSTLYVLPSMNQVPVELFNGPDKHLWLLFSDHVSELSVP